ncbi:MAG TPA: hypothetical protein PK325_06815 [Cyclobacteriaceae bacterium]|nr:hypothetical protein [Cyclobacteriaceae bacterium]HMV09016.1 hypothetical protein [Cyclobacteriaceae bacterium]HMV91613.1 hypothetical protein [Cyclobacteriaceae bacterium]HMW99579.1 hypothetical protein [Cyclobacteriaceae bacterium]HMX51638.1 hypothetical protein [Cyclobacteriaceae bacterium]
MRIITAILTTLAFTVVINARAQSSLGQIPSQVKHTADSLIKLLLGQDLFANTIFDCENSLIHIGDHLSLSACQQLKPTRRKKSKNTSEFKPEFYVLKYKLLLKGSSNYLFEVRIDKNLELKEKIKLPDCVHTSACKITVDSLSAIDLAIKSGLAKALGVYNTGLKFDSESNSFQWEVRNHIQTKPDRGESIIIDAVTGERIRDKDATWVRSIMH